MIGGGTRGFVEPKRRAFEANLAAVPAQPLDYGSLVEVLTAGCRLPEAQTTPDEGPRTFPMTSCWSRSQSGSHTPVRHTRQGPRLCRAGVAHGAAPQPLPPHDPPAETVQTAAVGRVGQFRSCLDLGEGTKGRPNARLTMLRGAAAGAA